MPCAVGCSTPTRDTSAATMRPRPSRRSASPVLTNAVVLFNTVYLQDTLDALRRQGQPVTDEDAAYLPPAPIDHINIHGSLTFDVERELARTAHRALRQPAGRR
jgi:hypothetical protein